MVEIRRSPDYTLYRQGKLFIIYQTLTGQAVGRYRNYAEALSYFRFLSAKPKKFLAECPRNGWGKRNAA